MHLDFFLCPYVTTSLTFENIILLVARVSHCRNRKMNWLHLVRQVLFYLIQVSSINFISIKHYIKIHQDKKDIYTTKSYGGVGWKANEA